MCVRKRQGSLARELPCTLEVIQRDDPYTLPGSVSNCNLSLSVAYSLIMSMTLLPFRFTPYMLLFLLVIAATQALDPACSEGQWEWYEGSTVHKGLSDGNSWDWAKNTSCTLHTAEALSVNSTCGRCDAKILEGDVWYRFESPWTMIHEVPGDFCDNFDEKTDLVDKCNAVSQLLLTSNGTEGYYNMVFTRFSGGAYCQTLTDSTYSVSKVDCDTFYLYSFPPDLHKNEVCRLCLRSP